MSEQILNQLLDGITTINQRLDRIESEQAEQRNELKEFREEVRADMQVLKAGQKGLRNEITDRFKEVKKELNDHQYGIDILNRRQLKLETDVEQLKNR